MTDFLAYTVDHCSEYSNALRQRNWRNQFIVERARGRLVRVQPAGRSRQRWRWESDQRWERRDSGGVASSMWVSCLCCVLWVRRVGRLLGRLEGGRSGDNLGRQPPKLMKEATEEGHLKCAQSTPGVLGRCVFGREIPTRSNLPARRGGRHTSAKCLAQRGG